MAVRAELSLTMSEATLSVHLRLRRAGKGRGQSPIRAKPNDLLHAAIHCLPECCGRKSKAIHALCRIALSRCKRRTPR